ncbi:MAG: VWA domain-containing protein [Acidobacteria bacterium]|nr:VWA domain-containing protein [Acidobacteriota bacterium]
MSTMLACWHWLLLAQSPISITDPIHGARVSGEYEVTWQVQWSEPIAQTNIYLDDQIVLSLPGNPGAATISFGEATDHQLRIEMTDQRGARLQSGSVETRAIRFDFAESSRLLLLTAVVRSRSNRVLTDFKTKDFSVWEDGKPIEIQSAQIEELPLDLVILLDSSSSLKSAIERVRHSAQTFVQGLSEQDSVALIQFHNEPSLIQDFTNDKKKLIQRIESIEAYGETAFFDALDQGLTLLKNRKRGRRALVVFTDGRDSIYEEPNTLARLFRQTISRAQNQETSLFTMGLGDKVHREVLEIMARESGGRYYAMGQVSDLDQAFAELLIDLRSQYLLSVIPQQTRKGFHRLEVKVKARGATVFARQGYSIE